MIGLSTSSLNLFKECARCFWLEKNKKIKRPRGIFPSLPGAMDKIMKEQVEGLIVSGKAIPALDGVTEAVPFPNRAQLVNFKSWRTFQREVDLPGGTRVTAWGELDDLLQNADGSVSPWDYKTKGTEPDQEYAARYNQTQLDMYHLLLEGHDLGCNGLGYLTYGWPIQINESGSVMFGWKTLTLHTDPHQAILLLSNAVNCLSGSEPPAGITYFQEKPKNCEWCDYAYQQMTYQEPIKKAKKK